MNARITFPQPPRERLVRVFISSTFRDMQKERDYLVKHVFPELRKRCRERAVEFVEVDLRWGVTEEQANRGEVLPICLREIELCRPYFICLLGERYGWVPDRIDPQLLDEQPWLTEHLEQSVTALEIVHGVLNNPEMAQRAYFYFRDPAYAESLPEDRHRDYLAENPEAQARLTKLKQRIRASGLPLKENYPNPEAVGQWILEDLWQAIDQEYPAGEVPDLLAREAAEHEAFALSRAKVYIRRPEYFVRLDEHAAGDGPPLVILGESGVGKSALLANWALDYRKKHPEDFLFLHFIGSTPQSTDYVALLHRLLSEIKNRLEDPEEVPAKPDKLREALPLWLAKASAWADREGHRIVIILDALNQIEDRDAAPDLGWLPDYFPPHVRVKLSTLPGRPLTTLEKRSWPTFTVEGLNPEEIRHIIPAYLQQYRKTLDERLIAYLVPAPQCANPLFLKALLEELRVFGVFEELEKRLCYYLEAATVPGLYHKILERLEEDYEKPRPGLVGESLSCLWAARRGLMESELLELLGQDGQPLPRAFWSPQFLALEESLISRSGLFTFFHDYLRQAVKERYLPTPEAQQAAHLRLANFFEKRELDDRKVDELPWQLYQAQAWHHLKETLCDLDFFVFGFQRDYKYEWIAFWKDLQKKFEPGSSYQNAIVKRRESKGEDEELALAMNLIGWLLIIMGSFETAMLIFEEALKVSSQVLVPNHPTMGLTLHQLSAGYKSKGLYRYAETYMSRAVEYREKVLGAEHPHFALSLSNLAWLCQAQGRYCEAEPLYQRALSIQEKVLGPEHPDVASSSIGLALLYQAQGRYSEAEPLYQRALSIREKVLGPEHPDVAGSLIGLEGLYDDQGRYPEAEPLCQRALALLEKVLGPEHPDVATSLSNLAKLYRAQGRYPEAEPLYQRALSIQEKVLGPEHPGVATFLNNLADLYLAQGRYPEAKPLHQRALSIREKVLGPEHPDVAQSLYNLAELYRAQGRYPEVESLHRRALALREKVLGPEHPDVARCLICLALLYQAQGRYSEAEPLCQRGLAILEKVLRPEHPDVATSLNNLALLYHAEGRYPEAEPLYQRALALWEKVLGPEHPDVATSLINLAALYQAQGLHGKAEVMYRRSLAIREKVLGLEHPGTARTLFSLAWLLRDKGDHLESARLYLRLLETWSRIQEKGGLITGEILHIMGASHNNLAFYTEVPAKNWPMAEDHYRRSLELFRQAGQPLEVDNVELNLQVMFHLSGQSVDLERIKELTHHLEEAGDKRAQKGRDLVAQLEKQECGADGPAYPHH
jgi:nephrocystin-3